MAFRQMIINGKDRDFPPGITINQLIEIMKFSKHAVTVRVNGERIFKEDYDTKLEQDSNVKIFSFIGGG